MGRLPASPQDAWQAVQDLATEVDRRLRASNLGRMTARGGAARWADSAGAVHVTVGDLGDGTNGLSTDGRVAAAGLSASDHNGASNVPTVSGAGVKVWIQASDPGGAAANGDVWIVAAAGGGVQVRQSGTWTAVAT